jgi:phosphohistidine phosphatase SixA
MSEKRLWTNPLLLYGVITVLLGGLLAVLYVSRDRPATTVILVRHAEKNIEPNNPNPALTPAGQARAQLLVHMLGKTGITAVYATQYLRTQWTVAPLADRLGLKINQIDAKDVQEVVRQIKSDHVGGVVFIAGHNNSVPAIIGALGGGNFPIIPENEYDNMFVVTIYKSGKAKTLKLKYGDPSPPADGSPSTMGK